MKSSLKKLKNFAVLRNVGRARKHRPASSLDELAWAAHNMNGLKDYYERLLSAAASTANSVYESLTEMGNCLLEKKALDGDERTGKVLLMMGKVQFELQKLIDGYRSHIIQTISVPSESLLNELRVVEEMKRRCDDNRDMCEELEKKHKEKGSSRNSKDEKFSLSQLQQLQDGYEEEANAFVFRMKSLKQAQSRSFLTQASRHYAAQLSFFRKAVRSLEAIEQHVKLLAEQHLIDYQINRLEDIEHEILDDYDDDRNDKDDSTEESSPSGRHDVEREVSYVHGLNLPFQDASDSKNLEELDSKDAASNPEYKPEAAKRGESSQHVSTSVSRSKQNSVDRVAQLGSLPSGKFASYVLPTPDAPRSSVSVKLSNEVRQAPEGTNSITLDMMKKASMLPPLVTEGVSLKRQEPSAAFYAEKARRQVHSGPISGKPRLSGQDFSDTSSSSALLQFSVRQPSSQVPRSFASSLKISELHELPRPPLPGRQAHPSTFNVSGTPIAASSPTILARSFSVPAGGLVEVALQHLPEESKNFNAAEKC